MVYDLLINVRAFRIPYLDFPTIDFDIFSFDVKACTAPDVNYEIGACSKGGLRLLGSIYQLDNILAWPKNGFRELNKFPIWPSAS